MNAVERLIEYTEEPTEAAAVTSKEVAKTLPAQWPTAGALQVHGLCIRYRPELPLVLDHVSFDVAASAKVSASSRTLSALSVSHPWWDWALLGRLDSPSTRKPPLPDSTRDDPP